MARLPDAKQVYQRLRYVFHPDRLKTRGRTRQRHDREYRLQLGKQREELVTTAEYDARAQDGHVQPAGGQYRFAFGLAALVHRRCIWRGTECTHLHDPVYIDSAAGPHQCLEQGDMGARKCGLLAMQYCHQVDDRVMAGQQLLQGRFVIHIAHQNIDPGQGLNHFGAFSVPRQNGQAAAQLHRLFAEVATHKTGATQNQNSFHAIICARIRVVPC